MIKFRFFFFFSNYPRRVTYPKRWSARPAPSGRSPRSDVRCNRPFEGDRGVYRFVGIRYCTPRRDRQRNRFVKLIPLVRLINLFSLYLLERVSAIDRSVSVSSSSILCHVRVYNPLFDDPLSTHQSSFPLLPLFLFKDTFLHLLSLSRCISPRSQKKKKKKDFSPRRKESLPFNLIQRIFTPDARQRILRV